MNNYTSNEFNEKSYPDSDVPMSDQGQTSSEMTIMRLVDEQADLLARLDEAFSLLAVHLEPLMREDPRSKTEPSTKKAGQPLLAELIEANNWRIEKAIGDLKTMQRLSAL